jgi:hypothetical protein
LSSLRLFLEALEADGSFFSAPSVMRHHSLFPPARNASALGNRGLALGNGANPMVGGLMPRSKGLECTAKPRPRGCRIRSRVRAPWSTVVSFLYLPLEACTHPWRIGTSTRIHLGFQYSGEERFGGFFQRVLTIILRQWRAICGSSSVGTI